MFGKKKEEMMVYVIMGFLEAGSIPIFIGPGSITVIGVSYTVCITVR